MTSKEKQQAVARALVRTLEKSIIPRFGVTEEEARGALLMAAVKWSLRTLPHETAVELLHRLADQLEDHDDDPLPPVKNATSH